MISCSTTLPSCVPFQYTYFQIITTPPPTVEETAPLDDLTPSSASCDLDLSLTAIALLENIEAGQDRFRFLDVEPAIHDSAEPFPISLPRPLDDITPSSLAVTWTLV